MRPAVPLGRGVERTAPDSDGGAAGDAGRGGQFG